MYKGDNPAINAPAGATFTITDAKWYVPSGSLWQLKRDKFQPDDDNWNINNSQLFQCNAALVGKTSDADNENIFLEITGKPLINQIFLYIYI